MYIRIIQNHIVGCLGLDHHILKCDISHVWLMVKIMLASFRQLQEAKVVLKSITNIIMTITCLHINLGSFNFEII